jgi:autotransporter-associated beta strand protein
MERSDRRITVRLSKVFSNRESAVKHPRQVLRRFVLLLVCAACGVLAAGPAVAQSLFFRPETGGANPASGGTYTWNDALTNWYTASSGGSATTWTTGSTATFPGSGSGSYSVTLGSDVTVGGVTMNGSFTTAFGVTISAASTQTITFETGAVVNPNAGSGRPLIFGDNVSLSGNFTLNAGGTTNPLVIGGNTYSGTVTIERGMLRLDNATSTAGTKVVMNSGSARLAVIAGVTGTIAQLSGSAGTLFTATSEFDAMGIVVNQATDTTFGGVLGYANRNWTFRKDGAGTLIFDGTEAHTNRGGMAVDGGALYIRAASTAGANNANVLTVAGGGTFGGVGDLGNYRVDLSGSSSRLAPGMFDLGTDTQQVGTLPLGKLSSSNVSLVATEGGTFDFALQAVSGSLSSSRITLPEGGLLTLGDAKTFHVNLIDAGLAGLEPGPYSLTLFSAASAPVNYATFESQWQLNTATLPSGWALADPGNAFEIVGNDIVMNVIIPVPEPATILMCLPVPTYLVWRRRKR